MGERGQDQQARALGALVLLGRQVDLAHFEACADMPARFYARFDGALEDTATVKDEDGIDHLLAEHEVVGLDACLLMRAPCDGDHEGRYRRNLAQKLAVRRVGFLVVLRSLDYRDETFSFRFLKEGESDGGEIRYCPDKDTFKDWVDYVRLAGWSVRIVHDEDNKTASVVVEPPSEGKPLVAAVDQEPGSIVALLEFRQDGDGLRSAPFDIKLARDNAVLLEDVLRDRARRQETEGVREVHRAWREAVEGMQADTRGSTQLEVVVIATRPLDREDVQLLQQVTSSGSGSDSPAPTETPKVRVWLMTERLRVGHDSRTLVLARHIWPDALSLLLARLCLGGREDRMTGMFAWRGIAFGPKFDAEQLERLRAESAQEVLTETTEDRSPPRIDLAGPFRLLSKYWTVKRSEPLVPDWDHGGAAPRVAAELCESKWVADHRAAGADLAVHRADIGRDHVQPLEDGSVTDATNGDPERVFSVHYWRRIHRSPGVLRSFAEAKEFRTQRKIVERLTEHLEAWNKELIDARTKAARDREEVQQHAEELDKARKMHTGLGWRIGIGSAVAVYTGFLALSLLRVLTQFSSGTWSVGLTIVLCGLFGGWVGAILPMWVERWCGRRAVQAIGRDLEAVDNRHRVAVDRTHALFVDADHMRQEARVAAVQRRTALLANRAWRVVHSTLESVSREVARKKLLAHPGDRSNESDNLTIEDQREWRKAAIVRPERSLPEDLSSISGWSQTRDEVRQRFLSKWQEDLEKEDPFYTGYLRSRVLQRLVRHLSADVAEKLEERLLKIGEEQIWESVAENKVKTDPAIQVTDWADAVVKSLGKDATMHPLLSVIDEGAAQRPRGIYRFFLQDSHLTREVASAVEERSGIGQTPRDMTKSLPLSVFGLLSHEVEIALDDDGAVRLVTTSDTRPSDGSATQEGGPA